jgi:hypothetical protein
MEKDLEIFARDMEGLFEDELIVDDGLMQDIMIQVS